MKLTSFEVGQDRPFFLIAGPCVIESEALVIEVAGRLKEMTSALKIPFIFKVPAGHCCRDEKVGGEPEMHLRYDLWDLPKAVQDQIKNM